MITVFFDGLFVMSFPKYPQKENVFPRYISFINPWMNVKRIRRFPASFEFAPFESDLDFEFAPLVLSTSIVKLTMKTNAAKLFRQSSA